MKSKNGKYNMKGGEGIPAKTMNLLTEALERTNANMPNIISALIIIGGLCLIAGLVILVVIMIISGVNKITKCIIMTAIMLIFTLLTCKEDIQQANDSGGKLSKFVNWLTKFVNWLTKYVKNKLKVQKMEDLLSRVKSIDPLNVIIYVLVGLAYIGSIIISIMSLLTGRNENMDILTIILKIFVFILTIISIICINFANKKNFIIVALKITIYILLLSIAFSCADQSMFYISNVINIGVSAIMAIFMILFLKFPSYFGFKLQD